MPSVGTRIGFVALLLSIGGVVWLAQRSADELHRFRSDDPTVWEREIEAFERAMEQAPPPPDAVVFIGASTIRFWETIGEDLAPLTGLAHGFGGAKLDDVLHYAERLVPARPAAIVVSIGGNDLFELAGNRARKPEEVVEVTQEVLERFHALRPDAAIYTLAIRPPILDPEGRDPASKVNAAVADWAERTPWVDYLDPNAPLYGEDRTLRDELQAWDSSQLSREGYRVWSAPIRERLMRDLRAS